MIVGCGKIGTQLADILLDHPEYGVWPVGFVDDGAQAHPKDFRIPVIGGLAQFPDLLRTYRVSNVRSPSPPVANRAWSKRSAPVTGCRARSLVAVALRTLRLRSHTKVLWGMPLTRTSRVKSTGVVDEGSTA